MLLAKEYLTAQVCVSVASPGVLWHVNKYLKPGSSFLQVKATFEALLLAGSSSFLWAAVCGNCCALD